MKQILKFLGLISSATGVLGGILVSLLCGDYWYIAVGIAVLAYAAFPRLMGWWEDLDETIKNLRKEDA